MTSKNLTRVIQAITLSNTITRIDDTFRMDSGTLTGQTKAELALTQERAKANLGYLLVVELFGEDIIHGTPIVVIEVDGKVHGPYIFVGADCRNIGAPIRIITKKDDGTTEVFTVNFDVYGLPLLRIAPDKPGETSHDFPSDPPNIALGIEKFNIKSAKARVASQTERVGDLSWDEYKTVIMLGQALEEIERVNRVVRDLTEIIGAYYETLAVYGDPENWLRAYSNPTEDFSKKVFVAPAAAGRVYGGALANDVIAKIKNGDYGGKEDSESSGN